MLPQPIRKSEHAKRAFLGVLMQYFADSEQLSAKSTEPGSVSHDLFSCGADAADTVLHFFLADEYHREEGVSFGYVDE